MGAGIETKAPNPWSENAVFGAAEQNGKTQGLLPGAHGTWCSGRLHGPWILPSSLARAPHEDPLWPPLKTAQ